MWYVIQTLKGQEEKTVSDIKENILEKYNEAFIIENEKMFKHKGVWTADRENLFPGYLFVDTEEPFDFDYLLRKKYKTLKLIRVGDDITPIKRSEEELLSILGGDDHIIRYSEGFKTGDEVIIERGALKNFKGEIIKIDRHNRQARISVSLFGRETIVTLGLGIIRST